MPSSPTVVAVIPARMASSRFPGKPLTPIAGLPMVEYVRRRALAAPGIDRVVVATCDREILDAVAAHGGEAVMTRDDHERCTTRVAEAVDGIEADIVVLVQGDEPLVLPELLDEVAAPLATDAGLAATNLLTPLADDAERASPDIVKAAVGVGGDVLFFSRGALPFFRERTRVPVFRQTGIMAFSRKGLLDYVDLPETPLERAESVDMLRLIEHGLRIRGVVADCATQGVDRPGDVGLVETMLAEDPVQRAVNGRVLGMEVRS